MKLVPQKAGLEFKKNFGNLGHWPGINRKLVNEEKLGKAQIKMGLTSKSESIQEVTVDPKLLLSWRLRVIWCSSLKASLKETGTWWIKGGKNLKKISDTCFSLFWSPQDLLLHSLGCCLVQAEEKPENISSLENRPYWEIVTWKIILAKRKKSRGNLSFPSYHLVYSVYICKIP